MIRINKIALIACGLARHNKSDWLIWEPSDLLHAFKRSDWLQEVGRDLSIDVLSVQLVHLVGFEWSQESTLAGFSTCIFRALPVWIAVLKHSLHGAIYVIRAFQAMKNMFIIPHSPESQPRIFIAGHKSMGLCCSTWTDSSGAILSQISYTLTNTSSTLASCTLGLNQPSKISQIWNVTNSGTVKGAYTVFTLPSWITQAGGIAANSNTTFGGIFDITSGSPQWIIFV